MSRTPHPAPPPSGAPPPPSPLKLLLVGDASAGKTSLRERWVRGVYKDGYRATIGCDYLSRRISVGREAEQEEGQGGEGEEGESVVLQVWDTAGQERFRSLAPAFYRSAHACLVVYSLTTSDAPAEVARNVVRWARDFADKCPVGDGPEDERGLRGFAWAAVGTKADALGGVDGEGGEERAQAIERAVEDALQAFLPSLSASDPLPSSADEDGDGQKTPTRPPPTVKVDVLPPRSRRRPKGTGKGIDKPAAVDPAASAREPPPPAESAAPPPTPSSPSRPASALSAASTASTSTTDIPSDLEPPEPTLDLLTSTSPPSPPPHFGDAGAPPALWIGGPYGADDPVLAGTDLDAVEPGEVEPDHREDEAGRANYLPGKGAGPRGKERERERAAEDGVEEVLHGRAEEEVRAARENGDEDEESEGEEEEEYEYERDGVRHFRRVSAKTGEGVDEVFDYLARRALYHARRRAARAVEAKHAAQEALSAVIKVGEHEKLTTGGKIRKACCS
ncbi:hypothetical protein JCM10207_002785 [Rhodosporidiobolus poonsookiae]